MISQGDVWVMGLADYPPRCLGCYRSMLSTICGFHWLLGEANNTCIECCDGYRDRLKSTRLIRWLALRNS